MFQLTTTWTNNNPNTIWNRLAVQLGREPTYEEAALEVRRILSENLEHMAAQGKLRFQRR